MKCLKKNLLAGYVQLSGVDIIYDKFEELGFTESTSNMKKYIKKIDKALIKYINERFNAMLWDVSCGYR